ncbi:bifunctional phosphoribosyl-AMP cyclohydrolase/phosphoribosyl-ATP pyrophosphatase [Helicobacter didelphidarum]|uniref:Imidazole glycerol phosphate synthase subunit HisH n=1 Tax=Helicobacter didelphidarum TaxID=2040648 RepID=A0A3D8ILY7_9HELI|nr:imidazole glycerol phosphate synthase subunit HisH [Helicobacter didelphidarum]RDU66248.1 bifunctional phosphoribosyl-AMP cyclohydrolase/phosphoribosyl-ATP pyrophosphatase [Helicobacter didelphidarum]
MRIGILDYDVGNITNVIRCLERISSLAFSSKREIQILRISNPDIIFTCDKILLPGVGAFGVAITNLRKKNLDNAIIEFAKSGRFILGICLGMQLLFEKSYEFGTHDGLGLVQGEVIKFGSEDSVIQDLSHEKGKKQDNITPNTSNQSLNLFCQNNPNHLKIPHIGWNKNFKTQNHCIIKDMPEEFYLYFVHSYHAVCGKENLVAYCDYGVSFPSIVAHENVIGMQPHPERSHDYGFKIMRNFLEL